MPDLVNHPAHYTSHPSGVECITVTEHMGFCIGNAVKHLWRADEKGAAIQDLEKARWYVDREIDLRRRMLVGPDKAPNPVIDPTDGWELSDRGWTQGDCDMLLDLQVALRPAPDGGVTGEDEPCSVFPDTMRPFKAELDAYGLRVAARGSLGPGACVISEPRKVPWFFDLAPANPIATPNATIRV